MTKTIKIGKGLRRQIENFYPNIRDVVLYVNSACNLRCRHCYIGNGLLNENNVFPTDNICAFIADFSSLSRITILGGEPLLHRGINRILKTALACDIAERRLTTNLTDFFFLDRSRLLGAPMTFAVSLDGATAQKHDAMRGAGSFAKTIRNLKVLLEEGFDIEISHTITADNIDHFEQLIRLCKTLSIKKLNLHKVSLQGNALDNSGLQVTPTRWVQFCEWLGGMVQGHCDSQHSIRIRYPPMYTTLEEFRRMVTSGEYWAHAKRSYYASDDGRRIVLYPNGRVYISSELFDTDSHVGNVSAGVFVPNEAPENKSRNHHQGDNPLLLARLGNNVAKDLTYDAVLSVSFKRAAYV